MTLTCKPVQTQPIDTSRWYSQPLQISLINWLITRSVNALYTTEKYIIRRLFFQRDDDSSRKKTRECGKCARASDSQSCHSDSVPPNKTAKLRRWLYPLRSKFPVRSIDPLIKTGRTLGKWNSLHWHNTYTASREAKNMPMCIYFCSILEITVCRLIMVYE